MKPKISTGYLTPQAIKTRKQIKTQCTSKVGTSMQNDGELDEKALRAIMNDPAKKAMIMQLLTVNKDAIQDFKKQEAKTKGSPVVEKVKKKRQIESPSALLRRRALKKINSLEDDSHSSSSLPESSCSHPPSVQSGRTNTSTESLVPFNKVMDGVVAFVEIRSKDQDRSGGAKKVLQDMGAKVREKFTSDVTHVIFKDGSYTTYQKAKLMKVPLVSILWVEFSRKSLKKQPEKKYPAMRSNHFDENTSIVCSQMQKEYEDIIRDEYRHSLMQDSPLPTTCSMINRRRTLMTTSSTLDLDTHIDSSYVTAGKPLTQANVDNEKEILTINSIDFDNYNPLEIGSPSKSVENSNLSHTSRFGNVTGHDCVDMELTNINLENSSSFYHRETPKIIKNSINTSLSNKTMNAPSSFFDRRKTICSSVLKSDESTQCNLLESSNKPSNKTSNNARDTRTNSTKAKDGIQDTDFDCGLKLSDKSTSKLRSAKKSKKCRDKSSTTSLQISDDEDSQILSRNTCKQNSSGKDDTGQTNDMSSLNLSSEQQTASKVTNSSMSSLYLSSDKPSPVNNSNSVSKRKTTMSDKQTANKVSNSSMSSLRLLSEKKNKNSVLNKTSIESTMSSLNLSSEKSQLVLSKFITSKGSFNSSGSSIRIDEEQINSVLSILDTPNSIELGKNSVPLNADHFNASVNSDDSEIELPDTTTKKARKIGRKTSILSGKFVDNQSPRNLVLKAHGTCETDDDSSPRKIRRKSVVKAKRLSRNGRKSILKTVDCDSNYDENSSREIEEIKGIRKSSRLSKITPVSNSESSNAKVESKQPIVTNNKKTHSNSGNSESDNIVARDAQNKSKCRKRKLYDPNNFVLRLSQSNDEKERQARAEATKLKSIPSQSASDIAKSSDQTKKEVDILDLVKVISDTKPSPMKKSRKMKKTTSTANKALDDSADEQKSLLNEIMNRKEHATADVNAKKEEAKFPEPVKIRSCRKPTKKSDKTQTRTRLFAKPSTSEESSSDEKRPNVFNRRSTLEFQSTSQRSSSKKPKINPKIKPTIVCTKLHKPEVEVFVAVVKNLSGFAVENVVSSRTTHLVAGEPKRTINMLRAVARGCWILKHEWLLRSLEHGKWLPEEDYEVTDFAPVVQKSRLERQAFGSSYTINIFEECDPIYVARDTNPKCSDLQELITLCKGKIVTCHRKAKIIIGEYVNKEGLICVNETWLLDCITFNKKLPFKKYLIEKTKSRQSIVV